MDWAKIAEGAFPCRHAEISPVEVKDTHLMNNKLPPAEILCGECGSWRPGFNEDFVIRVNNSRASLSVAHLLRLGVAPQV